LKENHNIEVMFFFLLGLVQKSSGKMAQTGAAFNHRRLWQGGGRSQFRNELQRVDAALRGHPLLGMLLVGLQQLGRQSSKHKFRKKFYGLAVGRYDDTPRSKF
jgi:hypothetical protein